MGKLDCNTDCEVKEVAGGTMTKILIFCMLITLGPKLISSTVVEVFWTGRN